MVGGGDDEGLGDGECLIEYMLLFRGISMLTILSERSRGNERERERGREMYKRVSNLGRLSDSTT
jgi:hypothetical protein